MNKYKFEKLVGNKIFSVSFLKKNGEPRTYNSARCNVNKDLVGGSNNQEAYSNLVSVYVLSEGGVRRTLNLDTIQGFKCGSREYIL